LTRLDLIQQLVSQIGFCLQQAPIFGLFAGAFGLQWLCLAVWPSFGLASCPICETNR